MGRILEGIKEVFEGRITVRKEKWVEIAKSRFKGELLIIETFLDEYKDKLQKINLLKIEIEAASSREDIEKLVYKLAKILELDYPE